MCNVKAKSMHFLYFVTLKSILSILHFEWNFLSMRDFVTYILAIWKSLNYTHHSNLMISLYNIKKFLVSFSSNISFIIGKVQALVFQNSKCHLKAQVILLATNNTGCFLEVIFSLLTKLLPNTRVWTQFICQSSFQVKTVFH